MNRLGSYHLPSRAIKIIIIIIICMLSVRCRTELSMAASKRSKLKPVLIWKSGKWQKVMNFLELLIRNW